MGVCWCCPILSCSENATERYYQANWLRSMRLWKYRPTLNTQIALLELFYYGLSPVYHLNGTSSPVVSSIAETCPSSQRTLALPPVLSASPYRILCLKICRYCLKRLPPRRYCVRFIAPGVSLLWKPSLVPHSGLGSAWSVQKNEFGKAVNIICISTPVSLMMIQTIRCMLDCFFGGNISVLVY